MARKRNSSGGGGGGQAWLNTYADMVTLLLTFFVLMISMSVIDQEKFNAFLESFQNIDKEVLEEYLDATQQGGGDGGGNSQDMTEAAMDTLFEKLEEYVQENNMESSVSIAKIEDVIYVRFDSAIFFKPNEYALREDAYDVLEFIGDGLKEFEKENIIIYHGEQKNMTPFFEMANCIIHPSYYPEGMSNVLLESAAHGRPIICTDRSGCRETVDDEVNGYVVPIKNTEEVIKATEKIIKLTNSERKQMGLKGRKKIEKEFDRNIVVKKYIENI